MTPGTKVRVVRGPLGGWRHREDVGNPKRVGYELTVPKNAIGVVVGPYEPIDEWFIVHFERHDGQAGEAHDGYDVFVPVRDGHVEVLP